MLTIFFRYDDYSSLSHPGVDRGLIEIFGRHGFTCTFAVVPAITTLYPWVQGDDGAELPLSEDKAVELRAAVQSGAVDVALHGWRHLANEFARHPNPSEFKGLPLPEQISILRKGCDSLESMIGKRPLVLVPPWNSYDDNTLLALEQSGFVGISANRYSPRPTATSKLKLAPMTVEINGLRAAISAARADSDESADNDESAIIGVMMHPYDFIESGDQRGKISLAEFEQELVWLKSQSDVRVVSISELFSSTAVDCRRFVANMPSSFEEAYPSFIDKTYTDPVYHSTAQASKKRFVRDFKFLVVVGFVILLGAGFGLLAQALASAVHPSISIGLLGLAVAAFVMLAVRAFIARAIYSRGAMLLALLSGACLGLLV